MKSKKFHQWLVSLSGYAMSKKIQLNDDKFYAKWYNSGYTPKDIIDNIEFVHNADQETRDLEDDYNQKNR